MMKRIIIFYLIFLIMILSGCVSNKNYMPLPPESTTVDICLSYVDECYSSCFDNVSIEYFRRRACCTLLEHGSGEVIYSGILDIYFGKGKCNPYIPLPRCVNTRFDEIIVKCYCNQSLLFIRNYNPPGYTVCY